MSRLDQVIGLAMAQKVDAPAVGGLVAPEAVRLAQPFRVSVTHSSINAGFVGLLDGAVSIGSVLRDLGLSAILAAFAKQQDGGQKGKGAERTLDPQKPPRDCYKGDATRE
ncbi:hypothetical protein [uncultured Brevundimonas sp.]|uniref:hypothetical protein n=1 Tax=uncultured Brevundimonas sp. TaxID=213418 RepID=UPI0025E28E32|nr:hypothetical protein [uncultured Brevundimonas sp.]